MAAPTQPTTVGDGGGIFPPGATSTSVVSVPTQMYLPSQLASVNLAANQARFSAMMAPNGTAANVARSAGFKPMGGVDLVSAVQPNGTYRAYTQAPIGYSGDLNNKFADKFRRGWLDGAGGADIEMGLGSTAFDVRAAPHNSRLMADWLAAGPMAPVPGLANWDTNAPDRTWDPSTRAAAEFIPSTWSNQMSGYDVVSGNQGPRVVTARQDAHATPTPQFYAYGQLREGGEAFPSYPTLSGFGVGAKKGKRGK